MLAGRPAEHDDTPVEDRIVVLRGAAWADEALPGLDVNELASYLDRPTASQAIREYRTALLTRRV